MLHFVTGRSGSGKTEYVRRVLAEQASAGNDKLVLMVPEQFSFATERALLASLGAQDARRIEVLSFTRLSDFVFRQLGGMAGTDAADGAKIILMLRALAGIQDKLEFYGRHAGSVSLAKEMLLTIGEFRQARVTPEQLDAAADATGAVSLSKKLKELSLVYQAYDALFYEKYTDADSRIQRLTEKLDETKFFDGYTIAVDGFKGFTGQELAVLTRLMKQADDLYLTLCTPDLFAEDPSMVFEAVGRTGKELYRLAKENGVPVRQDPPEETGIKDGHRFRNAALRHLEQNLFAPAPEAFEGSLVEGTGDRAEPAVRVVTAQTLRDECNFIAASAKKLMREEGFRCRDIAVVVRNEASYERELHAAFRRYGIPVFDDSRQPVRNLPLITVCRSVLALLSRGNSIQNLLDYLKTGLSPLTEDEAAELENYALLWDLRGEDFRVPFTGNPAGFGAPPNEQTDETLARLNGMRERLMTPLQRLRFNTRGQNFEGMSKALYRFLQDTGVPERLRELAESYNDEGFPQLAAEQERVWELTMDLLDLLANDGGSARTDVRTYESLFNAVMEVTDLGRIPQTLDEIAFGSADRIRLSSPRAVFVAGCAEGVFPAIAGTTGLLTAGERKLLNSEHGMELSLPEDLQASEERYLAYTAVTAAAERVCLSWHRSEGTDHYQPSEILDSVKALFPEEQFPGLTLDTTQLTADWFCETPASVYAAYADVRRPDTGSAHAFAPTFRAALDRVADYRGRLAALDAAADKKPYEILDRSNAVNLFGENMYLSASRVDKYYHCAFQYFCQYGLGAKPREKAQLDVMQTGTVIHYVLEQTLRDYAIPDLIALSDEGLAEVVDRYLDEYLDENMGGRDDKSRRFLYNYNHMALALRDVLRRLCNEFANSDFVPTDFELPIGKDADSVPCYALDLPNGGKLELFGSVDRVDTYRKDGKTYVRVVDYKSGGKDFALSDVLYGLNMQMLIYLFAIEAGGQALYGDCIVPSGIFYYPARQATYTMSSRAESAATVEKEKRKAGQGNGLFLCDLETITAMDHTVNDGKGLFIPVTRKDRDLSGNLATLADMGRIRRKVDELLVNMAESLHDGCIAAEPANGKNYEYTCAYCDYFAVCGFEDGTVRDIPTQKHDEVIDELRKEAADHV